MKKIIVISILLILFVTGCGKVNNYKEPEVYNDTEMGRTACYVETTGGVPVKVLDYNKFKADMEDKITSSVINFDTTKI